MFHFIRHQDIFKSNSILDVALHPTACQFIDFHVNLAPLLTRRRISYSGLSSTIHLFFDHFNNIGSNVPAITLQVSVKHISYLLLYILWSSYFYLIGKGVSSNNALPAKFTQNFKNFSTNSFPRCIPRSSLILTKVLCNVLYQLYNIRKRGGSGG